MTRYERQLEYMKGDKVWVLGIDCYDGKYYAEKGVVVNEISRNLYGRKRKGIIFSTRNYLTILKGGKEIYKCYRVEVEHSGIFNVSECMLERRNN